AQEGCRVTMLIVTDGSKGSWDPEVDPPELVAVRTAEQRMAADALGAREVVMLGHTDGELEYSMELREELSGWIRRLRPDVVLTHDPWKRYMLHPDHRVTGLAAIDGVVAARDHLFFPHQLGDGVAKHRPGWVLLWAADEPDYWEDVSATFDTKIEALLRHSSQGATTMGGAQSAEDRRAEFEQRIREWSRQQGAPVGLELAESFKSVKP
ncbi:MAG: PIG-L deacetylase family protein, partial [Acidimicrobiia bacterium]